MAEYTPVELNKQIIYSGYHQLSEIMKHLREECSARGYMYFEKDHNEIVLDDGKDIYLRLDIDRYVSDYVKLRIVVELDAKGIHDAHVELDGREITCDDGKLDIKFSSWVVTDYEGRWEGKSSLFFWRTILEKFVYGQQLEKFKTIVKKDMYNLVKEMKSYINLKRL